VVRGRCDLMPAGERCDNLHARGTLQVHGWCREAWSLPDGSPESMVAEAKCALRIIRDGRSRCRRSAITPWHGSFAALAARPCTWSGADERVRTMRRLLAEIRKAGQ
jgi:hypothetical protein